MVFKDLYSDLSDSFHQGIKHLLPPTKYTKAGQDARFRTMNGPLYSHSVKSLVVLGHSANPSDISQAQQEVKQAQQAPGNGAEVSVPKTPVLKGAEGGKFETLELPGPAMKG